MYRVLAGGVVVGALAVLLRLSTHAVASLFVVGTCAYLVYKEAPGKLASPAEALVDKKMGAGAVEPTGKSAAEAAKPAKARAATRFLKENPPLMEVVRRLRFVSMFDAPRFREWIRTLNQLQKVYIYILGGRYYAPSYKATFDDLRDAVLETMYGFVLIVPQSFKHIYGVRPDAVCKAAIADVRGILDTMSHVLAGHMTRDLGVPADGPDVPVAYNRYVLPGRENCVP